MKSIDFRMVFYKAFWFVFSVVLLELGFCGRLDCLVGGCGSMGCSGVGCCSVNVYIVEVWFLVFQVDRYVLGVFVGGVGCLWGSRWIRRPILFLVLVSGLV